MNTWWMNYKRVFIAGILVMLTASCQRFFAPEPTPTPLLPMFNPARGLNSVECPFNTPANSDIEVSCGIMEVPEDYANVGGRQIELFSVIVHSVSENPRRDPIVLLPQSAGLSLLEGMGYIGLQLGELLAERDLVYMEYRGLGHSGPTLDCPEYIDAYFQTMPVPLTLDQEAALYEEALNTCRERLINAEIDPTKYTVNEVAADLSALRLALGYEQLNLLAGGYGAEIAFTLLRDYPQAVRSAAIFEIGFPKSYLRAEMAAISLQQSIDLLFNRCLADEDCRLAYPDLEGMLYGAVDQLNRSPAEVKLFYPGQEGLTPIQVTGDDFLLLIQTLLMSNQTISGIPKAIDEVARGDVIHISDELQSYRMQVQDGLVIGPEISAACTGMHSAFFQTSPASQDVQPVVMEAVMKDMEIYNRICPIWTGSQPGVSTSQLMRSDVPVLILQGEFTPHLSPSVVGDLVREMKNAVHVVVPNLSNDFFGGESCGGLLIYEWVQNPRTSMDTSCVNNTEAIKFHMPQP